MQHMQPDLSPILHHLPTLKENAATQDFISKVKQRALINLSDDDYTLFSKLLENAAALQLLLFIHHHSPYLARLLEMHPQVWLDVNTGSAERAIEAIYTRFASKEIAATLRCQKQQIALATGILDISGRWTWEQVTLTLSDFAGYAVNLALQSLIDKAIAQHMLRANDPHGIFVLGMGKLGGRELNYSSDIDLIVLFDSDRLPYIGRQSAQSFMTRLAQELSAILQDRTVDGYVFRTDLRLRPDPSSTPLAVSTRAALRYYESVGQNWERAAMIKARVVAGDAVAGEQYLQALQPFMWRTHLDYAAVADILSIKRQMQSRFEETINPYGHNVKTGKGGIREIEFLAQIYQLIRGGRDAALRGKKTVEVIAALQDHGHIEPRIASRLVRSYAFFRTVEHRLQMQDDQQTHTLPSEAAEMEKLAHFMGFHSSSQYVTRLSRHLRRVHHHFTRAFSDTAAPLSGGSKLVFTGVDDDAETIMELQRMGFLQPEVISRAIQDWHKGNRRCTRTKRSRELLTELVPEILAAFTSTAHPDEAFQTFDSFMTHLPSGVQLFSLYASNPQLLRLTADIMGSAPSLGKTLSQTPSLFDAVLSGAFFAALPSKELLRVEKTQWLRLARNDEDELVRLCIFQKEKLFQAGVQLLKFMSSVPEVGHFLSDLSDMVIETVVQSTQQEFVQHYGHIEGAGLIVLGMGKLGSQELTFGSDLDLIFLYDADEEAMSNGARPLNASAYFNRLAQRIIGRLTAQTKSGRLYEVDTRLRPFGKDGPMAVSLASFERYHKESAWLFERLALTRARMVVVVNERVTHMEALLRELLAQPIPVGDIAATVHDMRRRINETFKPSSCWDVKHIHGGLMDVDFLLQTYALSYPEYLQDNPLGHLHSISACMQRGGIISPQDANLLEHARHLQTCLLFFLRLCSWDGTLDEATAPAALKDLLAKACDEPSFASLKASLLDLQAHICRLFAKI
ncbi:MAG: bifunctional [glutamine synthetase] adenylyltransferase/[glutamine synthetase]-adenylyl-L-tyrosine phosphorylase [Rickettsiales bacterium]|nr:bifunctional [glutamine synthetase] adenylyltransferase/[glutamine synthetase]-adenylyl-L-tyrosine phosphorylase [Rickettsiales bacterium]